MYHRQHDAELSSVFSMQWGASVSAPQQVSKSSQQCRPPKPPRKGQLFQPSHWSLVNVTVLLSREKKVITSTRVLLLRTHVAKSMTVFKGNRPCCRIWFAKTRPSSQSKASVELGPTRTGEYVVFSLRLALSMRMKTTSLGAGTSMRHVVDPSKKHARCWSAWRSSTSS